MQWNGDFVTYDVSAYDESGEQNMFKQINSVRLAQEPPFFAAFYVELNPQTEPGKGGLNLFECLQNILSVKDNDSGIIRKGRARASQEIKFDEIDDRKIMFGEKAYVCLTNGGKLKYVPEQNDEKKDL